MKLRHFLLSAIVFGLAGQAAAAPYSVVNLGARYQTTAINNAGQVLGSMDFTASVVNPDGSRTVLAPLAGGVQTSAYGINDHGIVAGISVASTRRYTGVIFTDGTPAAVTPPLGGSYVNITDINNRGVFVGASALPGDTTANGFIQDGAVVRDLGGLYGYGSSAAAVNERNEVAGSVGLRDGNLYYSHAMVWRDGVMRDLGTFGGRSSSASGINDHGIVIGSAQTSAGHSRAFMYVDGVLVDLGTMGGTSAFANDINNAGAIVGTASLLNSPYGTSAFLYDQGKMLDLNSLIDASSGWVLLGANGINDKGQIVGTGYFNGAVSSYLLNVNLPADVPEPASLAIFGIGLAALFKARKKRA